MAPIPAPIRVTLGLIATALDTVQELVEHAPEMPMEAVGNSMQLSLRLQQHYVALLTRGDEFLANLRGAPDEAPAWATFDETPTAAESSEPDDAPSADDAVADLPPAHREGQPRHAGQGDPLLDAVTATAPAPAAKKAARKAPTATKAAAKKVTAKRAGLAAKNAASNETVATPVRPAKKAAKAAPAEARTPAKKPAKKASPAKKAAAAKVSPAKVSPAKVSPAKVSPATTAAPENSAPAKRAPRRARKVPAAIAPAEGVVDATPIVASPTLDAELDNGAASARPLSAFDLAADAPEVPASAGAAPNHDGPSDAS